MYNRASLIRGVGYGSDSLTVEQKNASQRNAIRDFASESDKSKLITSLNNLDFNTVIDSVMNNTGQYQHDESNNNVYMMFKSGVLPNPAE